VTTIHHANAETHVKHMERLEAENHALRERLATAEQSTAHGERTSELQVENQALRQQLLHSQRLAALGTMTAMVAHEFNNILTPIINYAQLAQANPALAGKAIARAADGGKRASHICKAILGISRNCDQAAEANLSELISETLAAMAREPQKDGIELVLEAPAEITLRTRRVELQQVLLNLLINARWAVLAKERPRRIEIRAAKKAGMVSIQVADTGVGIEPENLDKIFQPFYTTRKTGDMAAQGHGLGLTICKDIVTSLGGEIFVRSKPGKGTTFTVMLPA
jgi:signal transduction histidine kinase